ncbi:MAG: hypothetical protein JOZ04_14320 [Acidimicrobiia bacterium]|nr:hypothetical protein [Acidimicrobiia bacterium]
MRGAAAAPTPTPNALKRWAATNGGGPQAQSPTLAQAIAVATNYSLVLATKDSFPPFLAQMRRANPAMKIVVYLNGTYAQSDQGGAYPAAWYARAADGSQVRSKKFGNYLMDPTSPGWVQSRIQTCNQYLAMSGYDGCYLDMLGNATMGAGYDTATPVNPATRQPWTRPQWIAATSQLGATVTAAEPNRLVVGNGITNGVQYFDPASGPTANLLNGLAGANAQGFIRSESDALTAFRSPAAWKSDVDMLASAGARGRFVMAMTKVDKPGTPAQLQQVHRYALASFLLGTNGSQYFYFSPTGNQDGVNAPDTPDDHVNPGMPLAAYTAQPNGAYTRPFSSGFVAVNPTAAAVTVNLGSTYVDLDGHAVQQATLAPHSGMVFTTPPAAAPTTPATPAATAMRRAPALPAEEAAAIRRYRPRRAP